MVLGAVCGGCCGVDGVGGLKCWSTRPTPAQMARMMRRSRTRSDNSPIGICMTTLPMPMAVRSWAAAASEKPTRSPNTGNSVKPPDSTAPKISTAPVAVGTA